MEQTAVEWLALRYHHRQGYLSLEDIAKAKEMEKEQIVDAYCDGFVKGSEGDRLLSEEYYNETYNK